MAGVLSNLLTDYSQPDAGSLQGIAIFRPVPKPTAEPAPEPKPSPVDHQAELIRNAEAKVRAEEREQAQKRLDEALAAERARFDEELQVQRTIWAEQEGLQLSTQLTQAFANFERALSDKIANILRPFVAEALRQQTLSEFEEALATLLSSTSARFITISGPEDILSFVRSRLGPRGNAIEFVTNEDVEVTVVAQDTAIETQLRAWSGRLSEVLEAD